MDVRPRTSAILSLPTLAFIAERSTAVSCLQRQQPVGCVRRRVERKDPVLKVVPSHSIVMGVPARVVGKVEVHADGSVELVYDAPAKRHVVATVRA